MPKKQLSSGIELAGLQIVEQKLRGLPCEAQTERIRTKIQTTAPADRAILGKVHGFGKRPASPRP